MAHPDYEEFCESLAASGVRYLIVGAFAVAHHARPRATKDFDIWVETTPENAERVLAAIRAFIGTTFGYSAADVMDPKSILQIGVAPVRIDVKSSIEGVADFDGAWRRRSKGKFGRVDASYLSLDDLIRSKEATRDIPGRDDDARDLRALYKARDARRPAPKRPRRRPR